MLPESVEFLTPSQVGGFAGGFSGHQGAVRSVTNQMKLKTREMPTLAAAASELGRRAYQGTINAIVATGIAHKDAPTFSGKRGYQGRIDAIVSTRIAHEDHAPTFSGKRGYQGRINTIVSTEIDREEAASKLGGWQQTVKGFAPKIALQRIAKI